MTRRALAVLALLAASSPALAVVPSTASRIDHTADGEAVEFTWDFVTYLKTDVEVLVDGVTQTEGFTVVLDADRSGGTVTFTAPPADGATVRIQRTVPLTQSTVYTPYSAFPAKTTERALDRGVMIAQQLDRRMTDLEATDFTGPQGPQGPQGVQGETGATGAPGTTVYDLMLSFGSVPLNGQRLAEVKLARAVTIPDDCAGAVAGARVAPTAQAAVTLKKNDVAVGTVTFNTNGTTAFTCADPIALVAGDRLAWDAQATADATLAGIMITLAGALP
jgi:hypothetical protein